MMRRILIAIFGVLAVIVPTQVAHAGTLDAQGVTLTWADTMYKPAKYKCNVYDFQYSNGVGFKLLEIRLDILDPYQQSLGFKSEIGVLNGASGTWNVQICDHQFTNGVGPYTFKLSIKDYSSNTVTRQTSFTFTEIPTPAPTPTPTPTLTPAPTPTPTTPTPTLMAQSLAKPRAKVKVGKSAKLAKKTKQGSRLKWKTTTKKVCKVKKYKVKGLKKGKCVLKAKASTTSGFTAYSQRFTVKVK